MELKSSVILGMAVEMMMRSYNFCQRFHPYCGSDLGGVEVGLVTSETRNIVIYIAAMTVTTVRVGGWTRLPSSETSAAGLPFFFSLESPPESEIEPGFRSIVEG